VPAPLCHPRRSAPPFCGGLTQGLESKFEADRLVETTAVPVKSYPVRVDFGLTPRPLRKAEIEEKTKVRLGPGTPGALNVDDTANLYFYGPGPPGAVKRPSRSLS
jgi:hypothetical protein